jgi:hypothetical protein
MADTTDNPVSDRRGIREFIEYDFLCKYRAASLTVFIP